MFTGLVQDVGTIERVIPGGMTELWIGTRLGASSFEIGESIAVDGACLTVVEREGVRFRVQAGEETLRRTTLGGYKAGTKVNLERALRMGDRLGGHLVQGHVDSVGEILGDRWEGSSWVVTFSLPAALSPFFIEKGSVAIDGISLTVMSLERDRFSIMVIPETREKTTLGDKRVGDQVNLEADLIGKYVARLYASTQGAAPKGGVSLELLRAAGFAPGSE